MIPKIILKSMVLWMLFSSIPANANFDSSSDAIYKIEQMYQKGLTTQGMLNRFNNICKKECSKDDPIITKTKELMISNTEILQEVKELLLEMMSSLPFDASPSYFHSPEQTEFYERYIQYSDKIYLNLIEAIKLTHEIDISTQKVKRFSDLTVKEKQEFQSNLNDHVITLTQKQKKLSDMKGNLESEFSYFIYDNRIPTDLRIKMTNTYEQLLLDIEREKTSISQVLKLIKKPLDKNDSVLYFKYFAIYGEILETSYYSTPLLEKTHERIATLRNKIQFFEHQLEVCFLETEKLSSK